jgi:hypothetical protein
MITVRTWFIHLSVPVVALLLTGCGHRQGSLPTAVAPANTAPPTTLPSAPILASVMPAAKTFNCPTADIQFNYPADWQADKGQTAVFAVTAPDDKTCCLSLDIPKLPWHPAGMLSLYMVASEYEKDLKKNQIHDAVEEEDTRLDIPRSDAKRVIASGHANGKTLVDMAVILIHADRVYILSADCDQHNRDRARKTLDNAVASLKWTK